MYKNKLKDGDLEGFTEQQLEKMRAHVEEKRAKMKELYEMETRIGL